ncbi:hypothetical protein BDZ88DRAFT_425247 [Geranomyces variabilis]|nr:hypothetical protein BDZ88DRAFT_425247 [Geranomyces variabilis]
MTMSIQALLRLLGTHAPPPPPPGLDGDVGPAAGSPAFIVEVCRAVLGVLWVASPAPSGRPRGGFCDCDSGG